MFKRDTDVKEPLDPRLRFGASGLFPGEKGVRGKGMWRGQWRVRSLW